MKDHLRLSLSGIWTIRQLKGKISLTGQVPGVVHHELIKKKLVEDPYFADNESKQQWVGGSTWEYSRSFNLSRAQARKRSVVLNCEGLDTLADIFINGKKIASTDNMFLRHRFDVKRAVRPGKNEIRIIFRPAQPEMDRRAKKWFLDLKRDGALPWHPKNRMFLRKSQCHSGWDWGPCFLTQGIYKDIFIECKNGAAIQYVSNTQAHSRNRVLVKPKVILDAAAASTALIEFSMGSVKTVRKVHLTKGENVVTAALVVKNPELWWPNGYGKQELTALRVAVKSEGETDSLVQQIGLRDLKLVTEKDKAGETFYFKVNGVAVFCKGSNWIPSDIFDSRLTDEQLEWELSSAAQAHHNMIRVWGGGLYERDSFYALCDKLGILVWQDFMFACALYPTNDAFLKSVEAEVRHQVRRLQHHPAIALWCGNNENEQCLQWQTRDDSKAITTHVAQYDRLYLKTIYPVVKAEDPGRRFWPSSPSNGIDRYGEPNDQHWGDTHYWRVWHGECDFTEYQKVKPRFNSEFGFQSFSSPETMETVTSPENRNICSPVFEYHQRSGVGNQKILNHISRLFRVPTTYDGMLYVSQALQAHSIKTAVEHWRRIKPHNMGTLYWQLNDIWPVASWSSLEFDGRWKMLHYASRKFFAPLLVSSLENKGNVEIWATSDINETLSGILTVRLMDFDGKIFSSTRKKIALPKLGSRKVFSLPLKKLAAGEEEKADRFLHFTLETNGGKSENHHFFLPFKKLRLHKPVIRLKLRQRKNGLFAVTLTSSTLAPFVWIRTGKTMGVFSDNGMPLLPKKQAILLFRPRRPVKKSALKTGLRVHEIYNSGI
jgi:beta-mannosidase